MKRDISIWLVVLTLSLSLTAFSAPKAAKKAKAKAKAAAPAPVVEKKVEEAKPDPEDIEVIRGLTSVEAANIEATANVAGVDKEWFTRLKFSGGFGTVGTNDTRETDARNATGFNRNAQAALDVRLNWGDYLGAALEGYYGTGFTKNYAAADRISGIITTRERSIRTYGGNFEARGRYTLNAMGRDWEWHLGLGYGSNSVRRVAPLSEPVSVENATLNAKGPYTAIGVQVLAIPNIALEADFAFSIRGGASYELDGTAPSDTVLESGNFNRFRLGAAYVLSPSYQVGLQYVRREVKGHTTAGTTSVETADQFAATFSASL